MGIDVAVLYRGNSDAAEAVCLECECVYGVQAKPYACDVSNYSAAKHAIEEIRKEFGSIQFLVNNAGVAKDGMIAMMSEEDYDQVLDINLKGAFNMTRHLSREFIKNGEGCIINISSVSGLMGNAGQCNYAASKAGLIGLTKSIARELAPRGVRCNAIAPGFIATDMTNNQADNPLIGKIPLGTMGKPEDIADAAAYLANANYVTGEVLRVDGGIAM